MDNNTAPLLQPSFFFFFFFSDVIPKGRKELFIAHLKNAMVLYRSCSTLKNDIGQSIVFPEILWDKYNNGGRSNI